jgi:hypothetical protein
MVLIRLPKAKRAVAATAEANIGATKVVVRVYYAEA